MASVVCTPRRTKITGLLAIQPTTNETPTNDILETINVFPKNGVERWHLNHEETISLAVDGSCKDHLLTFGLIMEGNNQILQCSGAVPSHIDEATSHRAELGGICKTIEVLIALTNPTTNLRRKIKLYCDNRIAVDQSKHAKPNPGIKNFDIIQQISLLMPTLPNIDIQWIKAHQDKATPFEKLTRPAQLNVMADLLAKKEWKDQRLKGVLTVPPTDLNLLSPSFKIQERLITTYNKKSLYKLLSKNEAKNYWTARLS